MLMAFMNTRNRTLQQHAIIAGSVLMLQHSVGKQDLFRSTQLVMSWIASMTLSTTCRQLSMERCEGLGRCELSNSSLQRLSLADCPNLHTLSLMCPALLCLNLEECKLLSQVSAKPGCLCFCSFLFLFVPSWESPQTDIANSRN